MEIVTVDQVAERLRERIAIEGARKSYRQNCESMQRVHISPVLGKRKMAIGSSPRTSSGSRAGCWPGRVAEDGAQRDDVPALGVRAGGHEGLGAGNPVARRRAARGAGARATPIRTCSSCTLAELDAVIEAIPDHMVDKDALGPVMRLVLLAAGDDRSAPVRAARPALAGRRPARAARPRPQRVGALRALGRGQVGSQHHSARCR